MKSIKHWPEQDRPREKLLQRGAHTLSDAELLALFLRTGTQGMSAVQLAQNLLTSFGGLHHLLNASFKKLSNHKGIGQATYSILSAAGEISRRYIAAQITGSSKVITNGLQAAGTLIPLLDNSKQEILVALLLNAKNEMILVKELSRGTINETTFYPRQLIHLCLEHDAAKVILGHNHPSGDPRPSREDYHLTTTVSELLQKLDIDLLDHLIVARYQCFSILTHRQIDLTSPQKKVAKSEASWYKV